jgi:hypothetical protein
MDRTTAGGGRSLTTCGEATSVLAEGWPRNVADVAQQAQPKWIFMALLAQRAEQGLDTAGVDGPFPPARTRFVSVWRRWQRA